MAVVSPGPGFALDFRVLDLTALLSSTPQGWSSAFVFDYGGGSRDEFYGDRITFDALGQPNGGTLTAYRSYDGGYLVTRVESAWVSVPEFMSYVRNGDNAGAIAYVLAYNDTIYGSEFADYMFGGAGNDTLAGLAGVDILMGDDGSDILIGGPGDDILQGGNGRDIVRYGGLASDFSVVKNADGTTTVTDLRAGSPEGVDTLTSIETLQFRTEPAISQIVRHMTFILRLPTDLAPLTEIYKELAAKWNAGQQNDDVLVKNIVDAADPTTAVASMSYQFFTGKVPTMLGLDYLVSQDGNNPNNLNSDYYAQFNTVNRFINFAVNLGKYGDGKDSFAAGYGALSLFDATKKAYAAIFGATPTDAKVHAIIDTRVDYLAYYGGDGADGIGTKAAMVGYLLSAGATENVGVIAKSNDAWLTDLEDGFARFDVSILDPTIGYYKADFIFGG
ncbi:calcium-binding protein [Caulobacter segnis]